MFDQFYRVDVEHVTLFGLDTNELFWSPWFGADDQYAWFEQEITSVNEWTIAFGHHPISRMVNMVMRVPMRDLNG